MINCDQLQGLFQCTSLDELTLDNNLLCNISGIGNLHSLRWLSLSCNQLTELPSDLWSLAKLHYLNLSHNALSNLQDLQHLTSLMELYLSANMVSSLRELFTFKSLCSLIVLDLTFNPVVTMDTYRPFVVFHLPFLKALDGRPIVSMISIAANILLQLSLILGSRRNSRCKRKARWTVSRFTWNLL